MSWFQTLCYKIKLCFIRDEERREQIKDDFELNFITERHRAIQLNSVEMLKRIDPHGSLHLYKELVMCVELGNVEVLSYILQNFNCMEYSTETFYWRLQETLTERQIACLSMIAETRNICFRDVQFQLYFDAFENYRYDWLLEKMRWMIEPKHYYDFNRKYKDRGINYLHSINIPCPIDFIFHWLESDVGETDMRHLCHYLETHPIAKATKFRDCEIESVIIKILASVDDLDRFQYIIEYFLTYIVECVRQSDEDFSDIFHRLPVKDPSFKFETYVYNSSEFFKFAAKTNNTEIFQYMYSRMSPQMIEILRGDKRVIEECLGGCWNNLKFLLNNGFGTKMTKYKLLRKLDATLGDSKSVLFSQFRHNNIDYRQFLDDEDEEAEETVIIRDTHISEDSDERKQEDGVIETEETEETEETNSTVESSLLVTRSIEIPLHLPYSYEMKLLLCASVMDYNRLLKLVRTCESIGFDIYDTYWQEYFDDMIGISSNVDQILQFRLIDKCYRLMMLKATKVLSNDICSYVLADYL